MQGDLSVSLWVQYSQAPAASGVLACKGGAVIPGRINSPRGGWYIAHLQNGTFRFAGNLQRDLAGNSEEKSEKFDRHSTEAIQPDRWYHLVMVLDRSEKTIRAWVDNVEQTASEWSAHVPDGVIESSHAPLVLFDSESQQMQGTDTTCALDDFRIYNKVLTPREVAELYSAKGDIPAGAPRPFSGTRNALAGTALQWMPGRPAPTYTFDVYFGTTEAAVAAAMPSSPEYKGRQPAEIFSPETRPDTDYFWRVDQVSAFSKIVRGPVWRFHTGGRGLFDPPLKNPGFENPALDNGAQDRCIVDWYDAVAYTLTVNEDADGIPATPHGNNWAELNHNRWIYQQIGYYTENRELEIRFLHGKRKGKGGPAVYVSLFAGGVSAAASDDNTKITVRNPLETAVGASVVATSEGISPPPDSGDDVKQRSVRLSTGTGHAIGTPLWLQIHTAEKGGIALVDQIQVLDVTER